MKARPIIGIDLGTTYSLVSVLQAGAPVVLRNAIGEILTASAVSVRDDGEILVGAAARARATTHPEKTALAFKRDMGTDRKYQLGGKEMTPLQLSALVLESLKRDAEAALGETVEEAVVTVPAYFGDLQRQATKDAGALAGLKVERIINEPTAAALAYGLHERSREIRAVVLDLGGGTFDVTVLEIIEGVIEIQASAGDARLGGEDFDSALTELISARIEQKTGRDVKQSSIAAARLRDACEQAKRRLSSAESARVVHPGLLEGIDVDEIITRAEAESAWTELLERVKSPIARALRDAGLGPSGIDEVLLVGGSTRMPVIHALAAQMFGRIPLQKLPPDEAIAMGAAIQAALKSGDSAVEDLVVTDVAPFSLGVATMARFGSQMVGGLFSPLIERGTVIPCSRVQRYSPVNDHQTEIHFEVFQGEHAQCARNQLLGEYVVSGLAPLKANENSVDVRFTYDLNGILEVEMTAIATGKKHSFVIEHRPGKLTADQIAKAREEMKKWKLHPREALPNTTALARAEALHAELKGDPRQLLAEAIGQFTAALNQQHPENIQRVREQLIVLTARLKDRAPL